MINEDFKSMLTQRSVIREQSEFASELGAKIGYENVFDFSLGNPSVPPPDAVQRELLRLLTEEDPLSLHGYTSAPGDPAVRAAVAENLQARYGTAFSAGDLVLTAGAAASLTVSLSALSACPFATTASYATAMSARSRSLSARPPSNSAAAS